MPKPPAPPPEARLLKLARLRRNSMSIAEAAELAGVSVSLWRQVEAGYSTPAAGIRVPKITPADTLAVMSRPLGITPAELSRVGRDDAAVILADLTPPEPATPEPEPALPDDENVTANVVLAAINPIERQVWAEIQRHPDGTPAEMIFSDELEQWLWRLVKYTKGERIRQIAMARAVRGRRPTVPVRRAG